ncbi:hypothetical protein DY000_02057759 [Brassica cretica]|uniref:Uncharacterized protein n=1 Tax=Brassica cretica TaxID=69181 RepID=A0ABQ7A8F8_BRACR|nr:hypothetical protein DY000_02057759 [Brassica cretica]
MKTSRWSIRKIQSTDFTIITFSTTVSVSASASMKTVVVRFADADAAAAADAAAYYITTADFIGVSRRTRRQAQLPASTKRTRIDAKC